MVVVYLEESSSRQQTPLDPALSPRRCTALCHYLLDGNMEISQLSQGKDLSEYQIPRSFNRRRLSFKERLKLFESCNLKGKNLSHYKEITVQHPYIHHVQLHGSQPDLLSFSMRQVL